MFRKHLKKYGHGMKFTYPNWTKLRGWVLFAFVVIVGILSLYDKYISQKYHNLILPFGLIFLAFYLVLGFLQVKFVGKIAVPYGAVFSEKAAKVFGLIQLVFALTFVLFALTNLIFVFLLIPFAIIIISLYVIKLI